MPRQPGRRSAAKLSVVPFTPRQAPEPPVSLTSEQAEMWRRICASRPADHFDAGSLELLAVYVQTADALRVLTSTLGSIPTPTVGSNEFRFYARVLRTRASQSALLISLARSLRLTQQSRVHRHVAATAVERGGDAAPKPWDH